MSNRETNTLMPNARISGIASYVPDDILDNEALSKWWIPTTSGLPHA